MSALLLGTPFTLSDAASPVRTSDETVTRAGEKDPKPGGAAGEAGNDPTVTSTDGSAAGRVIAAAATPRHPDAVSASSDGPSAAADAGSMTTQPTTLSAISPASPHTADHAHPVSSLADPPATAAAATSPPTATAMASAPDVRLDGVIAQDVVRTGLTGGGTGSAGTAQAASTSGLPPEGGASAPDGSDAADQVGASLLTLASSADGGSRISVSLHPKELGAVHVQLQLAPDGSARVLVAASEPGTLRSLMADQQHLHAALDAAAVPSEGRHMSFELAPATATAGGDADTRQGNHHPGSPGTVPGFDAQTGASMSGSGQPGRQHRGGADGGNPSSGSNGIIGGGDDADLALQTVSILTARLLPAGSINITA